MHQYTAKIPSGVRDDAPQLSTISDWSSHVDDGSEENSRAISGLSRRTAHTHPQFVCYFIRS